MRDKIYTMPSGAAFLPELARGLEDRFGERLEDALILLPTRRAVRELSEILMGEEGARILPRMRPLADIDPDEPPFEPGFLTGRVQPAISGFRRRFELARLVGHFHAATDDPLDPSAMLALADPLLSILDDAAMEEVNLTDLSALDDIRDRAAEHFQNAARFYEILQQHWPKFLREDNVMEPMARRVALLNALTDLWEESPPTYPVIIAGSTGTLAATARLMKTVVNYVDDGLIVLPGLDKQMPETAWNAVNLLKLKRRENGRDITVDPASEHPQFALKKLLSFLGAERDKIPVWNDITRDNPRSDLISEALVPVDSTADWPARIENLTAKTPGDFFERALDKLSIIEARTDNEEALAIALIMREVVENPGETAALITPDPALARRVKARLRRWHVNVDYSQGEPLEETAIGAFLGSVLRLAQDPKNPVHLASLFRHGLTSFGKPHGEVLGLWQGLERIGFRDGYQKTQAALEDELLIGLYSLLKPLAVAEKLPAPDWTERLGHVVEALASTHEEDGAARLWREDAGEKAASLFEDLKAYSAILGPMSLKEFARLLGTLMRGKVVRPRYGTHPRLQILGPLEARMITADRIILGGLNEGIWPQRPSVQPFLSRGMREAMGLSLPERRLGLAAHDFQQLASSPHVILTRAQRSSDGPLVASRWLWRLQTLVKGGLKEAAEEALAPDKPYLDWARKLDSADPEHVTEAKRPAPRPKPKQRWPKGRKLSVTKIKSWIRDPYAIYARYILDLRPLDDLGVVTGPREYGRALHKGIERFTKQFKTNLPEDAAVHLAKNLETAFLEYGFEEFHLAKERPRLLRIGQELVGWMNSRADDHAMGIYAEVHGAWHLDDVDFTLSGQADLVEKAGDGYTVADYKTGSAPGTKEVKAGFDPQLPLLGAMVEAGIFARHGVPAGVVKDLRYVTIKGKSSTKAYDPSLVLPPKDKLSAEDYIANAVSDLKALINSFDQESTAYHSQPRVKFQDDYGDYDLLARRGEWAKLGDEKSGYGR